MRIIMLNAWGGAMFDALMAWLPGCGADILCLQEVTRTTGLTGRTHFEDGERALPQRANLFEDVRQALPTHDGLFVASDAGPVTDLEGIRHQQDFGLAMFINKRLPIIGLEASFVHGDFVDHSEWIIDDRPRIAQAVRVLDRNVGRTITVGHLHGLRDRSGKADSPARYAQAQKLLELMERVRQPDDFTAVGGDLNLLPDSKTFDTLAGIGLIDLVGNADTRTSLYQKPVRHANYLLVSDRASVIRFETLTNPVVSDHRPVVLDI